jgi:hypothetical protein
LVSHRHFSPSDLCLLIVLRSHKTWLHRQGRSKMDNDSDEEDEDAVQKYEDMLKKMVLRHPSSISCPWQALLCLWHCDQFRNPRDFGAEFALVTSHSSREFLCEA